MIIDKIKHLNCEPLTLILTRKHIDHRNALWDLKEKYKIPVFYNKKEFDYFKSLRKIKADKWLIENEIIKVNQITLHVLETGGHSPGRISLYTRDIKDVFGKNYDGIIFTGDLIFKNNIGRSDIRGGNKELLCTNIKNKIMYNPKLTDNFLILAGHRELTTIGFEKKI